MSGAGRRGTCFVAYPGDVPAAQLDEAAGLALNEGAALADVLVLFALCSQAISVHVAELEAPSMPTR